MGGALAAVEHDAKPGTDLPSAQPVHLPAEGTPIRARPPTRERRVGQHRVCTFPAVAPDAAMTYSFAPVEHITTGPYLG
jgi:hypothetical protein